MSFVDIDPITVRFTHSKIRPCFSGCGRRIEDTIRDIAEGRTTIEQLPKITILTGADGHLFSLNNRRLYTFKRLREMGILENRNPPNTVNVRMKTPLPRELLKYTVDACSLNCSIMYESAKSNRRNNLHEGPSATDDVETQCKSDLSETESCSIQIASVRSEKKSSAKITFQDALSNVPTELHQDLKKALKLSQQGKEKQCKAILTKLEKNNSISKPQLDEIKSFVLES